MGSNYEEYIWRDPKTLSACHVTEEMLLDENNFRKEAMDKFRLTRDRTMKPDIIPDVKMGEDVGVNVVPDMIGNLLAEPLNLQEGEHKYFGRKTKVAGHRTQCQHKFVHYARRHQSTRTLVERLSQNTSRKC